MQKKFFSFLFFFFLLAGFFFRFLYLNWGQPFFFHPDENNIAYAILGLGKNNWNPHFFAYGSLPIYLTYITSFLFSLRNISFATVIFSLRFFSALLSFLLIPSLFYIGSDIYGRRVGYIATLLTSMSVGLIQYAHFGTFEMWLAFFSVWLFYFCYLCVRKLSTQHVVFTAVISGILLGIKVSTLPLLGIPFLIIFFHKKNFFQKFLLILYFFSVVFLIYFVTNPFVFFDTYSFLSAMKYESGVAFGTIPVFYTQSFIKTTPILFQLQYVFPFLLNPIIGLFSLVGVFFFLFRFIKNPSKKDFLLLLFIAIIFFSQAFFFVKWTRYMVPLLPFLYLLVAQTLGSLKKKAQYITVGLLLFSSFIFSLFFFLTVYPKDSRIEASNFLSSQNIAEKAIVEPYDLGSMAFSSFHPTSSNIYDIEQNSLENTNLEIAVKSSSFFILTSQRLIKSRLKNSSTFPKGNLFYKNLFDGKLGFRKIYQTPCDSMCRLVYLGDPINNVEETASVFDRPTVTIFVKQ